MRFQMKNDLELFQGYLEPTLPLGEKCQISSPAVDHDHKKKSHPF